MLEVPDALLQRLYEIEELSSTLQAVPPSPANSRAIIHEPERIADGREWTYRQNGLDQEEATNLVEGFMLSREGDDFPTRVAWELQSKLWQQHHPEVMVNLSHFCCTAYAAESIASDNIVSLYAIPPD